MNEESGRFLDEELWVLSLAGYMGVYHVKKRTRNMSWEQNIRHLDLRAVVRSTTCSGRKEYI